jgi:chromosome segregation ATPase
MDWKKRRQYLMSLAGNDVDKQLLQKAEYKPIADEIDKRNIGVDDLKKVMSDQKKKLTTELKTLPVRIDEARKSMPTLKEHEVSDAEYMLNDTKLSIERIDRLIIDAKAQGSGGNSSRFAAIKSELESVKRRMTDEHEAERKKLEFEQEQAASEVKSIENKIDNLKVEVNRLKESLSTSEKERDELRKEFITVRAQKAEISDTCPICGQTLPSDKVDEAHKEWEKNRKKRLLDIQTKGKSSADKVADLTARIKQQSAELERMEIDLSESRSKEKTASESLNSFPVEPDFDSNPRIHELEQRIEELKSTQQSTVDTDTRVEQLTARKNEMLGIIDRANQILLKRDMIAENEARIASYEAEMKDKGAELSEVELMLEQLDSFTQDRCTALEDSINSQFKSIRWKLFNEQINGGIVDCCTCMAKCDDAFVPYDSLNTASKIRSDIEISDALMKHNGLKIPILLDNGERITDIPNVDTQMIVLSVSKDDELKIELM